MDYKKKLEKFNTTEKYKNEMYFMIEKMDLYKHDSILDYGCGIGTMCRAIRAKGISCYGYDVNKYAEKDILIDAYQYRYTKVYFMHSFAHIPNALEVLKELKKIIFRSIYIFTPNKEWLDLQDKTNYIPDPTVIKHYTSNELLRIVSDAGYNVDFICGQGSETNGVQERLFIKASV